MSLDRFLTGEIASRFGGCVILMSTEGRLLDANQAALDLYGYALEDFRRLTVADIRVPRFLERIPDRYRGPNSDVRVFQTEHMRSDGSTFPVEVHAAEVADGDGSVVLCTVRVLSSQAEAELSLQISRARFDNIAATIPGVLYEYVSEGAGHGRFVYVGPGAKELLGLDDSELLDNHDIFWDLIHPDDYDYVLEEDDAADADTGHFSVDFRIIKPTGEIRWVHMSSRPLPHRPDSPEVWCGFMLDVTDRKLVEERLREGEQEAARLNAELMRLAGSDDLTGLANRRRFYEILEREIDSIDRIDGRLSVISLDLDGLKRVNDTLGHGAGDDLLVTFGTILAFEVGEHGVAGRHGGDEFSVVLPGVDAECALDIARRIVHAVRDNGLLADRRVTVSSGVAQWEDGDRADGLMRRADIALYISKRTGGDMVSR